METGVETFGGSGSGEETSSHSFVETQRRWAQRAHAETLGESFGGDVDEIASDTHLSQEQEEDESKVLFLRQQRLFAWRLWWQYFNDPVAWQVAQQAKDHTQRVNDAFAILMRMLPEHAIDDKPIPIGALTVMGSLYEVAWMAQTMPDVKTYHALKRVIEEVEVNDEPEYIVNNIRSIAASLTERFRERIRAAGDPAYASATPSNIQEDAERVFFAGQITYVALLSMDLNDLGCNLLPSGKPLAEFAAMNEFDSARKLYELLIEHAIRTDDEHAMFLLLQQQQQQQQQQQKYARGNLSAVAPVAIRRQPPALTRQQSRLIVDPLLEAKILVARDEAAKRQKQTKKGVSAVYTTSMDVAPTDLQPSIVDLNKNVKGIAIMPSKHKRNASGTATMKISKKERAKNRLSWISPTTPNSWISSNGSSSNNSYGHSVSAVGASNVTDSNGGGSPRSFASLSVSSPRGAVSPRTRNLSSGSTPLAESRSRISSVSIGVRGGAAKEPAPTSQVVPVLPPIANVASLLSTSNTAAASANPLTLSQWTSMFKTPLDIYVFCDKFIGSVEAWIKERTLDQLKAEGMHAFIRDHTSVSTLSKQALVLNRVLYEVCQMALAPELLYDVDFLAVLHPFAVSMLDPATAYRIQINTDRMLRNRPWIAKDAKPSINEMGDARVIALLDAIIATVEQNRLSIEVDLSTQLLVDLNEDPLMNKISSILRDFRTLRMELMREFAKPPPPPPERTTAATIMRSLTVGSPANRRVMAPERDMVVTSPTMYTSGSGSGSLDANVNSNSNSIDYSSDVAGSDTDDTSDLQ